MKAVQVCHLQKTFRQEWRREFPSEPFPVLKGIDNTDESDLFDEPQVEGYISSTRDRLVATNQSINKLCTDLRHELAIKHFLIRLLAIFESGPDIDEKLAAVESQLSTINSWDLNLGLLLPSHVLNKSVNDLGNSVDNCSHSNSGSSTFVSKISFYNDRASTLPSKSSTLRYDNSRRHSDKKDAKVDSSTNKSLTEQSEEEMFKKKLLFSKSGEAESRNLGSKDNFLAVKSKLTATHSAPQRHEGITDSPKLTRNFQLLKLTDGFDLVLGETTTDDQNAKDRRQREVDDQLAKDRRQRETNDQLDKDRRQRETNDQLDKDRKKREEDDKRAKDRAHRNEEVDYHAKIRRQGEEEAAADQHAKHRRQRNEEDQRVKDRKQLDEYNDEQAKIRRQLDEASILNPADNTRAQSNDTKLRKPNDSPPNTAQQYSSSCDIYAIQLRKPELRSHEPRSEVTESEVTTTKETFHEESSTVVVCSRDGRPSETDTVNVHNFSEKVDDEVSFRSSLRKFSQKGSVVPPPVAKKPTRGDSGKKLPPVAVKPSPITDTSVRSGYIFVNQVSVGVNTHKNSITRSFSAEGSDLTAPQSVTEGYKHALPSQLVSEVKFSSQPNLCDDDSRLGDEESFKRNVNDISVLEQSSSHKTETTDTTVATSYVEVTTRVKEVTEADMNHYDLKTNDHSHRRGSISELVGGLSSGFFKAHTQEENADRVPKTPKENSSSPVAPQRNPVKIHDEMVTAFNEIEDGVNKRNTNCHILITSASTDASITEVNNRENVTPDITSIAEPQENSDQTNNVDVLENQSEAKKRLSSTSSYENWTINRAITTRHRDVYSASDDEELDEISTCSPTVSPYLERHDFSRGSKDSGLCDDLSTSELSHSDIHSDSGPASDQKLDTRPMFPSEDITFENSSHKTSSDKTSSDKTVDNQAPRDPDPGSSPQRSHEGSTERLSMASDRDDGASTIMNSSYDETDSVREGMLKMRQLLVKGVLDSEKSYLGILTLLMNYKRSLEASSTSSQPVISKEDIQTIFSDIDMVNEVHTEFVKSLEPKVLKWTAEEQIGDIFKIMISKLINFSKYLNNYQLAVSTIHRCCQESEKFANIARMMTVTSTVKEVTSLEDALFKPVQRVQRNTLVLHDLIKYTPEDHPDYKSLQKSLKLSQHIIENLFTSMPVNTHTQENRRLVKSSFLVELVGGVRKLRYIFLFSDVIICTRRDTHRNNKVSFVVKWFAPLSQIHIDTRFDYNDDTKPSNKDDIDELKGKLKSQKRELKAEIRKSDDRDKHRSLVQSLGGGVTRNVEKIKKKVNQTEAQLILASPRLPFKILIEGGRPYTLLMSTDYEREEWKEAIASLSKKVSKLDISSILVQEMVNSVKETPQVNKIGTALLQNDEDILTGILNVTIHKVNGLTQVCDTYCSMEMDSYGHFFFKAKTTICEGTMDPAWNEDFDLELEGSQTLRILCFKKEIGASGDKLLGRGALELSKQWLKGNFQEKTISLNEISLVISVRHIPSDKTMQRTPSRTSSAVFGVSISSCAKRENKTVPSIVTACIQEVEKRGLDEIGIYRVSGVSSDLQSIKRLFDKNSKAGSVMLQDADINTVTGVLKLYLRELPEPLFTEASYQSFVDTLRLSDEEAKAQCMLALFHNLPDTNYYTAVYLLEHLIKVAKNVGANKMSIHNLSTIFGPTLLAPASKQVSNDPLEMMCREAEQVLYQSSVVNFLLGLAISGRSLRRSAE